MSKVTPAQALKKAELERRISVQKAPEDLADVVVGCAECHTLSPDTPRIPLITRISASIPS